MNKLFSTRREFLRQLGIASVAAPFLPKLFSNSFAQGSNPVAGNVLINICLRNGWCPEAAVPGIGQVSQAATQNAYYLRNAPLRIGSTHNGMDLLNVPGLSPLLPNIVVACGLDGKPNGHDDHAPLGAVYRNRQESFDHLLSQSFYSCRPPISTLNITNPDVHTTGQSVVGGEVQPVMSNPAVLYTKILNGINLGATVEARQSLDFATSESQLLVSGAGSGPDYNTLNEYTELLSRMNTRIAEMCAVSPAQLGPTLPNLGGEDLNLLASIHGDLIRAAIQCGVRIINIYVQRSPNLTAQAVHGLSHESGYVGDKQNHFRWVMQKYFVDIANKVRDLNVSRGMILVSNEIGIRDSMHGRWSHVYPSFVWGTEQPWQLSPNGRILNFQDPRKPLAPQSDFHYGALAVQYFTTVMDYFGVNPSAYEMSGHRGFGDASTAANEDSNYASILPLLGNPLPGFRS